MVYLNLGLCKVYRINTELQIGYQTVRRMNQKFKEENIFKVKGRQVESCRNVHGKLERITGNKNCIYDKFIVCKSGNMHQIIINAKRASSIKRKAGQHCLIFFSRFVQSQARPGAALQTLL